MATESGVEDGTTIDDPIAYFLEEQRYHGKSERTIDAYERVLRQFETFVRAEGSTPADATRRECMAWVHSLRGRRESSTIASYASYVHRFYEYMTRVEAFEGNPMALVMEEMGESIDTNPTRREISIPEMRDFVDEITHPLERAVVVTLLKTGVRVGELCNLDLRDLHVDAEQFGLDLGWTPRVALESRPQSLYVDSKPARGSVYNGEKRSASNKRKRETVIPVDQEVTTVLLEWLAIRPDPVSPADPLFVDTGGDWGHRLEPSDIRYIVERHAREQGWYRTGGGASENVTPHYFRHFFTTHLRDRTGDRGVVKYLRGDVASDIIDTYTHDWGDQVRTVYESNIYSIC